MADYAPRPKKSFRGFRFGTWLKRKHPIRSYGRSNKVLFSVPYVQPLAHDPRVSSRFPDSWKSAIFDPWRSRLFLRKWGRNFAWPSRDMGESLREAHRRTYPVQDAERVVWNEPTRFVDVDPADLAGVDNFRVYELCSFDVLAFGTGVLERIGTYVRAQALTAAGAPVGPVFITNVLTDPCALPFSHAEGAGDLSIRWHLLAVPYSTARPTPIVPLTNAPPEQLPIRDKLDGIPIAWDDLRYGWGARFFTSERHVNVQGSRRVTLYASVAGPTDRWTVKLGGTLSGYFINAGKMGHALQAATRRFY